MNSLTNILTRSVLSNRYKCRIISNVVRLDSFYYCSLPRNSKKPETGIHRLRSFSKLQTYLQEPFLQYFYFSPESRIDRIKKFFVRLLVWHSKEQIDSGLHCYNTISKINYAEFFHLFDMPDTFYSWFKLTELHVWMLLVRLSDVQLERSVTRKYLVEALWFDTETRAKKVEALNKNYSKNLRQLNDKFRVALLSYDEGLLKSDQMLASALWYQFFDKDCDDPRKLEALVSYIRYQIAFLESLTVRDLTEEYKNKMIWTPVRPHFKMKIN